MPTIGVSTLNDSEDQSATVSLGTARDGRKLNGRIFYDWQDSEYEESLPYLFERAGVDGSYLIARSISLVGEVGKESALDESTTEGGLDSDFWNVGLRWEPDDRTFAEARYGERFFGSSTLSIFAGKRACSSLRLPIRKRLRSRRGRSALEASTPACCLRRSILVRSLAFLQLSPTSLRTPA